MLFKKNFFRNKTTSDFQQRCFFWAMGKLIRGIPIHNSLSLSLSLPLYIYKYYIFPRIFMTKHRVPTSFMGKKTPADFRQNLSRRLRILVRFASCRNARSPQWSHSRNQRDRDGQHFWGANKCICFRVMGTWKFISCVSKLHSPGFFLQKMSVHFQPLSAWKLIFCDVSFNTFSRVGHFNKRCIFPQKAAIFWLK